MFIPSIEKQKDGTFFALCLCVDEDTNEVLHAMRSYNGRIFKTFKAAEKSTLKHIAKIEG